jgi:hypothetical protein
MSYQPILLSQEGGIATISPSRICPARQIGPPVGELCLPHQVSRVGGVGKHLARGT